MRLSDLFEKRRNPQVNSKKYFLEELMKYSRMPNVFVSFTSDVGRSSHEGKFKPSNFISPQNFDSRGGVRSNGFLHNTRGSKLGINPKSEYGTPVGIYAYPMSYVLQMDAKVPFAGDQPYLHVFRAKGNILNLSEYTDEDLNNDIAQIKAMPGMEDFDPEKAKRGALIQTPGGRFWNVTRVASFVITNHQNHPRFHKPVEYGPGAEDDYNIDDLHSDLKSVYGDHYQESVQPLTEKVNQYLLSQVADCWDTLAQVGSKEDLETAYKYNAYLRSAFYHYTDEEVLYAIDKMRSHPPADKPKAQQTAQWTAIIRKLGYDGVVDNEGNGIIHENEPTQAVFFNVGTLQPLEVIGNNTGMQSRPKTEMEIWLSKPRIFQNMVRQGKVPADLIIKYFNLYPAQVVGNNGNRYFVFSELPAEFRSFIIDNIEEILYRHPRLNILSWIKPSEELVLRVLKKEPAAVMATLVDMQVTPAIHKAIQDGWTPLIARAAMENPRLPLDILVRAVKDETNAGYVRDLFNRFKRIEQPVPYELAAAALQTSSWMDVYHYYFTDTENGTPPFNVLQGLYKRGWQVVEAVIQAGSVQSVRSYNAMMTVVGILRRLMNRGRESEVPKLLKDTSDDQMLLMAKYLEPNDKLMQVFKQVRPALADEIDKNARRLYT